MIRRDLQAKLDPVVWRQRHARLWMRLAACWALGALLGGVLWAVHHGLGWGPPWVALALAVLAAGAASAVGLWHEHFPPDYRGAAREVEQRHPELDGVLLTAAQQEAPGPEPLHYLQEQVVDQAVALAEKGDWRRAVPASRLAWVHAVHLAALAAFAGVLWVLHLPPPARPAARVARVPGVTISPGDTSLERGESLVVLVRFGGPLPSGVELVVGSSADTERRTPLVRSLADPVFGGSVPDVTADLVYRVDYGGERSRTFQVKVYEHPRLEKADAELTFPDYTGKPAQRIEEVRRLSAVEGSRLDLHLQLNKPVALAQLVARDREKTRVPLDVAADRPAASLKGFVVETSRHYDLQLVDADGRTNKVPAQFILEALKNRTPELRLTAPRGDQRPSPLEEVTFEGTVSDDFGVKAFGVAYTRVGQDTQSIELGRDVPARDRRPFAHLLRLEDLEVQPDQLISWYAWAEDLDPDGQVRRTTSDLFFAEVRPFEEIFREGQGGESQGESQSGEQSGPQGGQSARLAELQKQIINATWKLQREHNPTPKADYPKDAVVVLDSQVQALEQAETQAEEAADARAAGLWDDVTRAMGEALDRLGGSTNSPAGLAAALVSEQAAYQALLRLQAREYEVTRSRRRSRSQSQAGEQRNQRQLDQLELAQSENRYETQRQARAPQDPQRREQAQVLNRLQELARRQQDLNERLKELQTALQEARTEAEREEIRRQLKRLQEEERQMLADVDEVRNRMEQAQNASNLAEQRQQLDQTRNDLQRAAEAAREGAVSQALAAGTRAQRQLQDMRDALRRQSASEFADEMREMRADARELAQKQEEVGRQMESLANERRRSLSDDSARQEALQQLAQQKERATNLLARATEVSQQAEVSEPLLSRQLYDTLRQFNQDETGLARGFQEDLLRSGRLTRSLYEQLQEAAQPGGAPSLEITADLLREGLLPQAGQAQRRARSSLDGLRRGVERAAESILGDDTEALRTAQRDLEELAGQLEREIAQAEGAAPPPNPDAGPSSAQDPSPPTPAQPNAGGPPENSPQQARTSGPSAGEQPPGPPQDRQGQGRSPGQGQEPQSAQNPGQGGSPQETPGAPRTGAEGQRRDTARAGAPRERDAQGGRGGSGPAAEGGRFAGGWQRLFDGGDRTGTGPILGEDFAPWSDRLRDVEEMLEFPDLRNDVASARERARQVRLESRRDLKKPDWAVVRLQVLKPLVEVQSKIRDELSRRDPQEALVPVDRDPVPGRYSELVRRYYEDLGKEGERPAAR